MSAKRNRRQFTTQFEAEVALSAVQEREPLTALAVKYRLAPAQITTWQRQLRQPAALVFETGPASVAGPAVDVQASYAQLGRLQMENTVLKTLLR